MVNTVKYILKKLNNKYVVASGGFMKKNNAVLRVISYASVYVGAVIGAGYASGQEILQFFAGYGYVGIVGAMITMLLLAWYGAVFMELGHRLKTNSHKVVCRYLCGNIIGGFADYILLFFMFGMITIMISGGGAAMNQYYGWDPIVGKVIIAIVAFSTVFLGFSSALKAFSFLTPLIVVSVLIISMVTIGENYGQLTELDQNLQIVDPSVASQFWWFSAIIYVSYNVVPGVSTFASLGNAEKDVRVARYGGFLGGGVLGICIIFITIAIFSNLIAISGYEIPFLEIARQINYTAGLLFSIILVLAIYTTAVSNIYGFSIRFFKSNTTSFKITVFMITLGGLLASMFPFSKLVGTVYPILGILGLFIMACAMYKTIKGEVFSDKVERIMEQKNLNNSKD